MHLLHHWHLRSHVIGGSGTVLSGGLRPGNMWHVIILCLYGLCALHRLIVDIGVHTLDGDVVKSLLIPKLELN